MNNENSLKEQEARQDLLPQIYILSGLLWSLHTHPPFFSSYFLFSVWWIRFLISVPEEGNKELCCWSYSLICTLMKSCKPAIPFICYPAFARPQHPAWITRTAPSWLTTSEHGYYLAAFHQLASRSPHQRLNSSNLLAHVSQGNI